MLQSDESFRLDLAGRHPLLQRLWVDSTQPERSLLVHLRRSKENEFFVSLSEFHYTNDGILIPMGHAVPSDARQTSLLYNEYIVYNTDQINMKYLLRVDFEYKY